MKPDAATCRIEASEGLANGYQSLAWAAPTAEPDHLATTIIRNAIDRSVSFMGHSWDYNNGDAKAETRIGNALRGGYRQKVFLMTKAEGHTKEALQNNWVNHCAAC